MTGSAWSADQHGCPTATIDIAEAILAIDRTPGRTAGGAYGTYHFAGTEDTSWHGFAAAIVAAQAPRTGRRPPVEAIASAEYPTPARRPAQLAGWTRGVSLKPSATRAAPWRDRVDEARRAPSCRTAR